MLDKETKRYNTKRAAKLRDGALQLRQRRLLCHHSLLPQMPQILAPLTILRALTPPTAEHTLATGHTTAAGHTPATGHTKAT